MKPHYGMYQRLYLSLKDHHVSETTLGGAVASPLTRVFSLFEFRNAFIEAISNRELYHIANNAPYTITVIASGATFLFTNVINRNRNIHRVEINYRDIYGTNLCCFTFQRLQGVRRTAHHFRINRIPTVFNIVFDTTATAFEIEPFQRDNFERVIENHHPTNEVGEFTTKCLDMLTNLYCDNN